MDMLDIVDAPESKPIPNVIRDMMEPRAEIWRRGLLPNRCNEINMNDKKRWVQVPRSGRWVGKS
jgi:hypothetical protein